MLVPCKQVSLYLSFVSVFLCTHHHAQQPLLKITAAPKLEPVLETSLKFHPLSSASPISAVVASSSKPPSSQPSLSLRISTAHLKRPSPSESLRSITHSPESARQSDDTPSPYQRKAKKHKGERKPKKKHKHKEQKRKHKHKRSSRDSTEREGTPMDL